MNDHDRLRSLLADIGRHTATIGDHGHELVRRARIGSRADGYPRRASGAEPGSNSTGSATMHRVSCFAMVTLAGDDLWQWQCSCGKQWEGEPFRDEEAAEHVASLHADTSSALDYSDPTGQAAVTPPPRDPVRADARRFLRLLASIEADLASAVLLITRQVTPNDGDPGCDSCAHIPAASGKPRWEPVDPRVKSRTDVGCRLDTPRWLCRWCRDFVGIHDRLPNRDELTIHLSGKNLRESA
jgi:hypothetical protein